MNLPEFAISLGGSAFLLVLFLAIAVGLAIFFYRSTIPPIPPRRRLILSVMRTLVLTALLFLIFEPLLRFIFHNEQPPAFAVLIDDSESMTVDSSQSARLRELLKTAPFASLPVSVRYFRFSSDLTEVRSIDSLQFAGEVTDMGQSLARIKELRDEKNIQAVALITDGNFTAGRNPVSVIEDLDIPLYTLGVGDTLERRDVLITKVVTSAVAYAESRVPVDVHLRSSGYASERVEVTLGQSGETKDRKILQLQPDVREYTVPLSFEANDEGTQKFIVNVSSLPGELTSKNNSASFFIKVLKTKVRILAVAGAPGLDVSAVRQTLSEERDFTIHTRIQRSNAEFYEGPITPSILDSTECFILVGYPSQAASRQDLQEIADAVILGKKPMLFIASRTLDFQKLSLLEGTLPFSWTAPSNQELAVFADVPEHQRSNILVQLGGDLSPDTWSQLPPIFKTQTTFRAKPESEVLAFAKIQSVVLGDPLLLLSNVARQKSFAITGHAIWRWRLLAQGSPHMESFFAQFLTNIIRWLTTADEGKNVRVTPTKETFTTVEPVEFTGQVYDEQFRPVDGADVRIEIVPKTAAGESLPGRRIETNLRSIGTGRYEGNVDGLGPGDYSFTSTGAVDGTVLGRDKGRFSVGRMNVEFLETRMNRALLEQLAFRTGGMYAGIDDAGALVDSIHARTRFSPKQITHASELELWNWNYVAGLLILVLAGEWFVRKKSGMV